MVVFDFFGSREKANCFAFVWGEFGMGPKRKVGVLGTRQARKIF